MLAATFAATHCKHVAVRVFSNQGISSFVDFAVFAELVRVNVPSCCNSSGNSRRISGDDLVLDGVHFDSHCEFWFRTVRPLCDELCT